MKNDYEIRGDVTAIFIKSQKFGDDEVLISTSKLEMMKSYPGSWHLNRYPGLSYSYCQGSYVDSKNKRKSVKLHRFITNAPEGMVVDHINHDTLNNTDENLRVCTISENQQNRNGVGKNSKSGIRGVHWIERRSMWAVRMILNGKKKLIGHFKELQEAELAAIEARRLYMPFSKEYAS
jgi:hypothetical protein